MKSRLYRVVLHVAVVFYCLNAFRLPPVMRCVEGIVREIKGV